MCCEVFLGRPDPIKRLGRGDSFGAPRPAKNEGGGVVWAALGHRPPEVAQNNSADLKGLRKLSCFCCFRIRPEIFDFEPDLDLKLSPATPKTPGRASTDRQAAIPNDFSGGPLSTLSYMVDCATTGGSGWDGGTQRLHEGENPVNNGLCGLISQLNDGETPICHGPLRPQSPLLTGFPR